MKPPPISLLDGEFRKLLTDQAKELTGGPNNLTTVQRVAFLRLETALLGVELAMAGLDPNKLVKG